MPRNSTNDAILFSCRKWWSEGDENGLRNGQRQISSPLASRYPVIRSECKCRGKFLNRTGDALINLALVQTNRKHFQDEWRLVNRPLILACAQRLQFAQMLL
jgi:hypothetical protein